MNKIAASEAILLLLRTEFGFDDPHFNTVFNDQNLVAGEDAEMLMSKIADIFGIGHDEFFMNIPYRKYFDVDYGLAALPLVPFFWLKTKVLGGREIREVTVSELVSDIERAFPKQLS
jgi:hypothetical protein